MLELMQCPCSTLLEGERKEPMHAIVRVTCCQLKLDYLPSTFDTYLSASIIQLKAHGHEPRVFLSTEYCGYCVKWPFCRNVHRPHFPFSNHESTTFRPTIK